MFIHRCIVCETSGTHISTFADDYQLAEYESEIVISRHLDELWNWYSHFLEQSIVVKDIIPAARSNQRKGIIQE